MQLNYFKKPWCCAIKVVNLFSNFKNIAKTLKQKITIKLAAQQTFLIGMRV